MNENDPPGIIKFFSYTLTLLVGAVANHLREKYSNRSVQLQYTTTHIYLGASENDPILGTMQVTHNGTLVDSLYLSKVVIDNPTFKDLDSLTISFYCDSQSIILTNHIRKSAAITVCPLNPIFLELAKHDETHMIVRTRRDYDIPVFNRKEKIEATFVITNLQRQMPAVWATIDKKGVTLKEVKHVQKFMGEPQSKAALTGALATFLICPLVWWAWSKTELTGGWWPLIPIEIAALIGVTCLLLGIFILKIQKVIAKVLS